MDYLITFFEVNQLIHEIIHFLELIFEFLILLHFKHTLSFYYFKGNIKLTQRDRQVIEYVQVSN